MFSSSRHQMLTRRGLASSLVAWVFILLAPIGSWGAPPAEYYNGTNGLSGGELKEELRKIISRDHRSGAAQHTIVPYELLHQPMREIWRNPEIPSNILLFYSSPSVLGTSSIWNREHLWPRSRGNSEQAGPDESDLFHVVPAYGQVNSLRSNRYFDNSDPNDPSYTIPAIAELAPQASYDSNSWQPAPGERGDIARAMFYMDVRYNGSEPNTTDLELVSFSPSGPQMGNLNTLLLWHAEDPPDDAERERNDLIYASYQGNRNPFIDRPELVEDIWGTGLPGDPLNNPLARVEALGSTASESPSSAGRFAVSMNQFASPGGVRVRFQMSGAADLDEYTLSGDVVSYNSSTGLGEVLIQQGFSKALVILTPIADGVAEEAETAEFIIATGEGYDFTPDFSSSATITIRDAPWLPAYWNFNEVSPTALTIPSNTGDGVLSFANWRGVITSYTGTQGKALALEGTAGNNSSIDFSFSMAGYKDLNLSFATRGTGSGFTTGIWSFSTDGTNFTDLLGNTGTNGTAWLTRNVSFSGYSSLTNAASVTVRYTLSGATGSSGNNRIDELRFSATQLVTGDQLREVSVGVSPFTAIEQPLIPANFRFSLTGLAPPGGLTVAFVITGDAVVGADYEIVGAQSWNSVTRTGTVFFEENTDTQFIALQPASDNTPETAETVILSLTEPFEPTYLVGQSNTATALIRDEKHNNNFADAFMLSGFSANATGDNIGATRETGEPRHFGTSGSNSVWWRWTAPTNATMSVSTVGSGFDTLLAVYSGTALSNLFKLASDDNSGTNRTSRTTFAATAGTTYFIAVDGVGTAPTGSVSLSLAQVTSPVVTGISPARGSPGSSVTLSGFNFSGATSVTFGQVTAAFSIVSDNQIIATVPEGATYSRMTVLSSNGSGQSSLWFRVTRRPSVPAATLSKQSLQLFGETGEVGNFTVSTSSMPAPLRIEAPAGFEVSVNGQNFSQVVEISAPLRFDTASSYGTTWANLSNQGNGFQPWSIWVSQGTGNASVGIGNPEDSGVTNFGTQAFSLRASPAGSNARASANRKFIAPMAVGESFSFRWALNWDPNTSSGYNYINLNSGDDFLVTIWQGNFPGPIYVDWQGSSLVDAQIEYGTQAMTWTFTLINSSTLRISATDRSGGNQVVFSRDIPVAGAPDAFNYTASQLDPDINRRGYFNDLKIDSPVEGGGHLPSTLVHVRKAADGQGNSSNITLSSGGQQLQTLSVSMASQAGKPYDSWVQTHGLDLNGNGDRGADPDSDGYSNLHEFLFGTDPKSGQGTLLSHAMHNGNFVLTFLGRETSGNYSVQSTGNLVSGPWALELIDAIEAADQSGIPGGYKRLQFVIPVQPGNRFYRLKGDLPE